MVVRATAGGLALAYPLTAHLLETAGGMIVQRRELRGMATAVVFPRMAVSAVPVWCWRPGGLGQLLSAVSDGSPDSKGVSLP